MAANIRLLRRRIKTAKNIAQITKAMEMVSASKMRKAQEYALAGKPYAQKLMDLVGNLSGRIEEGKHLYLKKREKGKILLVLFSSDKGLAGSFNTNILREYLVFMDKKDDVEVISIGKKLQKAVVRGGSILAADFPFGTSLPSFETVLPIVKLIIDDFSSGVYKKVVVLYPQFITVGLQKPTIISLLPIEKSVEEKSLPWQYKFEPSADDLLTALMPHYLETTLYQIFLEVYASEQAARMIAMHQASENAKDVIWDLSLTYNKARQERITSELLDITGATFGATQ